MKRFVSHGINGINGMASTFCNGTRVSSSKRLVSLFVHGPMICSIVMSSDFLSTTCKGKGWSWKTLKLIINYNL